MAETLSFTKAAERLGLAQPTVSQQIQVLERGLRKLSLGVFPDNARAIAVYERRGFVREGLRRMQYRSGDMYRDEVLMAWFPKGDGS